MQKHGLEVIEKPDWLTWEEITELIHQAFAKKDQQGMRYHGAYQSVETTQQRGQEGMCFVALWDGKLVGTATLVLQQKHAWYNGKLSGYMGQLAVHPDYAGKGVGQALLQKRMEICRQKNVDELIMHTAIHATDLIGWWQRLGAQKVELLSTPGTNFYAVRMRLPLAGKKFNPSYVKAKYLISCTKCILLKNQYGQIRKLWKILPKYRNNKELANQ